MGRAAGDTGSTASEVQTAAAGLGQQAEKLNAAVNQFLAEIRAA